MRQQRTLKWESNVSDSDAVKSLQKECYIYVSRSVYPPKIFVNRLCIPSKNGSMK